MENKTRSVLKSISWRFVATSTTVIISLLVTHNLKAAGVIGSFELVAKLALYYYHERFWNKVKLLREQTDDPTELLQDAH